MTITSQIKNAIEQSICQDEIVHLTILGDAIDEIATIHKVFDGKFDYMNIHDDDGRETLDVWGRSWRLMIRFES